jgi:hypothetical protein
VAPPQLRVAGGAGEAGGDTTSFTVGGEEGSHACPNT